MCVSMLCRVVAIDAAGAVVSSDGGERRAAMRLYPDVGVGDWVLVGAGAILQRLTPEEARSLAKAYGQGASDEHP
jgi:hydrogenase assembly chaperone HypC/HupF